ncbi:MAG: maleylpyruvate isomerase N-terminal domain-containing protein, partial [Streptosporangiaceae bacterium]
MSPEIILEAFGGESRRLSEVVGSLDDAAFARPTPCDPWTVAELVCHVAMTMRRLPGMLAPPEPAGTALVPAAGYYRADQRFSAATNAAPPPGSGGSLWADLQGGAQVGALPVVVEDAQDLRGAAAGAERVGDHRGELRGLAGLDHDG